MRPCGQVTNFLPKAGMGGDERRCGGHARLQTSSLGHSMPNVYFHVATAYNILRHIGVPVGKRDFLGNP